MPRAELTVHDPLNRPSLKVFKALAHLRRWALANPTMPVARPSHSFRGAARQLRVPTAAPASACGARCASPIDVTWLRSRLLRPMAQLLQVMRKRKVAC